MSRYRAEWILPIAAAPIRGGWVELAEGRVTGVGASDQAGSSAIDLGRCAVLPGLVNAHTHLELSHLRNTIAPSTRFIEWIRSVVAERRPPTDAAHTARVLAGIESGIAESIQHGSAVVGDISNSLLSVAPLSSSALDGVVFYELIRFNTPEPAALLAEACQRLLESREGSRLRVSLAAHAPYSVSPELFRGIRRAADGEIGGPVSVHLAESPAESQFIDSGTGDWRQFLDDIGAWNSSWSAPGVSPVEYLDRLGFIGADTMAVHGVQMTERDLAILAARGATLVASPRSNQRTGAGVPPVASFFSSGVQVAVGTDSLASTPDLSVFAEIAELRRLAPAVSASRLLESATLAGARALGVAHDFGTIEPGKRARLVAVAVPPGIEDVEEYLLSGIRPEQIRWLDD